MSDSSLSRAAHILLALEVDAKIGFGHLLDPRKRGTLERRVKQHRQRFLRDCRGGEAEPQPGLHSKPPQGGVHF